MKKERWINGPVFPKSLDLKLEYGSSWCSTALNSSSAIFFGFTDHFDGVATINLKTNHFRILPKLSEKLYHCSATILHSKTYDL